MWRRACPRRYRPIRCILVATIREEARVGLVVRTPAALIGLSLGTLLGLLWCLLPPTGSDLSAQVAHAHFAVAHLWQPVDLQWFGGAVSVGYSFLVPPLMAVLGVRFVGVAATALSAGLFGLLISRCHVLRARAGAVAGALCLFGNLVVGRLTFAVGVATGLTTLLALTFTHWSRWLLIVFGPIITWGASPLAALFLLLVGAALVIRRPKELSGILLTGAASVSLAASLLVGQRGYMPSPVVSGLAGFAACVVVAMSTQYRLVRIGAVLAACGVLLSMTVHTEVGMNAVRLPALFGAPVLVATSRLRMRRLVPAAAATVLLTPPLMSNDVTAIGNVNNEPSYYAELIAQLDSVPLTGRVEIPPTENRWESVYVAAHFPLARGWMTQLDTGYASLFFAPRLHEAAYRRWLHHNAVQYVALPDAQPAQAGAEETKLIASGLPFLHQLWKGDHWTIYTVAHPTATVTGAKLIAQNAASVRFRATAPTTVLLRVRWAPWLTLNRRGACLQRHGLWTDVVTSQPGTYMVGSAMVPGDRHRECPTG